MRRLAFFLLPFCLMGLPVLALEPDNLLLLTNKNVPEGRKLAEYYTAQRKVPDKRILELDLPAGEQISFDAYENQVVPAVREFLAANDLQTKVTCLVTFYGLPLKIAARVNSAADQAELAQLRRDQQTAREEIAAAVAGVEGMARETDSTFTPGTDASLPGLIARDRAARTVLGGRALQLKDPQQFEAFMARAEKLTASIVGAAPALQQRLKGLASIGQQMSPEQRREAEAINAQLLQMRANFDRLQAHRGDPASRAQLRTLAKEQLGLIEYARLLEGMTDYFTTDATGAAFDSELALVQWNFYTRAKSLPNPMRFKGPRADMPPILMTMRLDAPQPLLVRSMILAGVRAEAEGLPGRVVVDAGGNLSIDSKSPNYAAFDQTLRNLATIVRTKTQLALTFDEKREVLAAQSVKEPVAVYCGWYALQHYTPACTFFPGAVGYHVASFELTSLHNENSHEWCQGLLKDGIAATLGAVNEPFLNAFPPPDEFFPLLLTGKLTLAEVYWKTNPMVSWQIAMIGDPLYNPYKLHPALAPEALDEPLQGALKTAR
jgi:uncharacterized protein (TIGR03790 family)